MILIAGASNELQLNKGGFQECKQMDSVKPFVKFAVRITHLEMIPFQIAKAFRMATFGRPGPVYIELPGDLL